MRESSGRTTSSKRPDSSCSSSVTRAWNLRPFLSIRTMSPAPMPLDGATPGKLDGRPDGLPDAPVQRHVPGPVGANVDQRGPVATQRGVQLGGGRDRLVGEAVE